MPNLNLQINALAFYDQIATNNPMIRAFDQTYKLFGIPAINPEQKAYTIPAGTSQVVYDGTRTDVIDGTSSFNMSQPYPSLPGTYRFTWNGTGTNPVFRTDRDISINTSTVLATTVNGPLATYTATSGPFVTSSIQVGDILQIQSGAGNSSANQGTFVILAVSSNSVTVQNNSAAAETFTIADPTQFLIYSSGGSSNQVQINDRVIISAGFSLVTRGTYLVSNVTPTWFEIQVSQQNGLPIETNILPGASGIVFYQAAKSFMMVAAQQSVSVRLNAEDADNVLVDPIEVNNPERQGLMIKTGSFYKMVIYNNGVYPAAVIVATVE